MAKVFKPKALILDLHGTITPVDLENRVFRPHALQNLRQFLDQQIDNFAVRRVVLDLAHQSQNERHIYEHDEVETIPTDFSDDAGKRAICESTVEFVEWQIKQHRDGRETNQLIHLISLDALRNGKVQVELFDDVIPSLDKYQQLGIKICMFSSLDCDTLDIYLAHTSGGDIRTRLFKTFDSSAGSKTDAGTYKKIVEAIGESPKDILFVTDRGQEAKAAANCDVRCLLMSRPGNKPMRTYYLERFSRVESLDQIELVERRREVEATADTTD